MPLPQLDQFSFHARLADTPGPALVFFTAQSCASCRYWRQLLEDWAQEPDAIPVFAVDAGQDQALAREFELFHLPALFLFVDGEYHRPIACEARLPALQTAIAAALRLPAAEAP